MEYFSQFAYVKAPLPSFKMAVIFLLSCSEIEEGSPREEVVETEETQEVVATDGENRSVSHS